MALTLELVLDWQSALAAHRDRYWIDGLDPADSDLPPALATQLASSTAGAYVSVPLSQPPGQLSAHVLAQDAAPGRGYLAVLAALKHGIARQADLGALAALAEPYARPHEDDAAFYAQPRLVDHLDTAALALWREFTARFVRPELAVLDLMASHDSHLPAELRPARMTGLGMNAAELAANPHLTEHLVHDLNHDPRLPYAAGEFDVVLCALSIEYLIRPVAVLSEVRRVLKPGGRCVVSFSERWFPPKAVLPWSTLTPFARVAWVLRHFQQAGFTALQTESLRGRPRPADDKYIAQTKFADPLYAVWGTA